MTGESQTQQHNINEWLQQLDNALKQPIDQLSRLNALLLLRRPFGAPQWQSVAQLPLKDYSTELIEQLFAIANKIDDWPMMQRCCQIHQGLATDAIDNYRKRLGVKVKGANALRSDNLTLTLMNERHMADFFWQYSEDIAYFCKLPDFDGEQRQSEWREWLVDCQNQPSAYLFAIEHLDWGFVGSICFDIAAGRGFFYYWVGGNFRKLGVGSEAVKLVLDWATLHLQLDCCYAVIFAENIPSQKALQKLDFVPVELKVDNSELQAQLQLEDQQEDEFEEELVFYRGATKSDEQLRQDLNQLFIDIGSELEVIPLT